MSSMEAGQRYGRLVAVRRAGLDGTHPTWLFRCDCGFEITVRSTHAKQGRTRSCGCLKNRHGMTNAPEYVAWENMLQRCNNPLHPGFHNYGGRGITVCEQWLTFENFLADVGRRPSDNLSIHRIDNDGDYEPGNIRWATAKEQAENRRADGIYPRASA